MKEKSISGIILVGPPKSGKTFFAKRLCKSRRLSHLSLDALIDVFESEFPKLKITHDAPTFAEIQKRLRPVVNKWIDRQLHYKIPFLLEGYHMDIGAIHRRFAKQAIRVIGIGYPSLTPEQKLYLTRHHSQEPDWTKQFSDSSMAKWFEKAIVRSQKLQQSCKNLRIPFIDSSTNFAAAYRSLIEHL